MKKSEFVHVNCKKCNNPFLINKSDFDFNWETVETEEREMGIEILHECTESFECPECGNECIATFHVWEYPLGVYNYDKIETDGCEIEESDINLSEHIQFNE